MVLLLEEKSEETLTQEKGKMEIKSREIFSPVCFLYTDR